MPGEKIFLLEYITAGGMNEDRQVMDHIMIEGLAMLKALILDADAGKFEVHAFITRGLQIDVNVEVRWHEVEDIDECLLILKSIDVESSHVFVVAPEIGKILENLTSKIEDIGFSLLSQPSEAIATSSDKYLSLNLLKSNGVKAPATLLLNSVNNIHSIEYPLILKPRHGAGSAGVFKVLAPELLKSIVATELKLGFREDELVIQEYIDGTSLSASVLALNDRCELIGINHQFVSLSTTAMQDSKYQGGIVGQNRIEIQEQCEKIASIIKKELKLNGYFGFDFVLDDLGEIHVVEVNPRLTTSFIGISLLNKESMLKIIQDPSSIHEYKKRRDKINNKFIGYGIVSVPGINGRNRKRFRNGHDVRYTTFVCHERKSKINDFFVYNISQTFESCKANVENILIPQDK
ncbi:MAG: ATP-grasp domain-containing protein [Promethearchaeota archaeon]